MAKNRPKCIIYILLLINFSKNITFRVLCGKRYAGWKKVLHRRWRLISGMPLWLDRKCHPCDIICRFVFGKSHNCKSQTRPALKALIQALMTLSLGSPVSARLAGGGRGDRVEGCHCRETGEGQFFLFAFFRTQTM